MKSGKFSDEIFIQKPAQEVLAFQADISQHGKVHPLIIKVEKIESKRPGVPRYAITDRLKMGPFTFKIVYYAEVEQVSETMIHSEAWQSPGVHVINATSCTPQGDGCLVKEETTIEAPGLLFGYTFQQARDSHMARMKNIKKYLESL